MDRFIRAFPAKRDADLMICDMNGVAYQRNMKLGRVNYGADYFAKVEAYEGGDVANAVNAGRCALLKRNAKPGASVLDFGAGSGAFVRAAVASGFQTKGFDVMPLAAQRLRAAGLGTEKLNGFEVVTLWDTIEHLENPETVLSKIGNGAHLFVSIPVFMDLTRIRESKHYRPGEHLYYWTALGFIDWLARYGFRLLEQSSHETDAGRQNIGAFAFCRDLILCKCGGEMFLDSFRHPCRPEEWFMRCRICGAMGESADAPEKVRQAA